MALRGDSLLLYSATWDMTTGKSTYSFTFIDTRTKKDAGQNFIKDGTDKNYTAAYEIAVNPDNGDFFVTDAKDYITPGKIYCYGSDGPNGRPPRATFRGTSHSRIKSCNR